MTWYSVDRQLPDAFKSVLVYTPGEAPFPTVHEGYYAEGGWIIGCAALKFRTDEVTHWADMPEFKEGNV